MSTDKSGDSSYSQSAQRKLNFWIPTEHHKLLRHAAAENDCSIQRLAQRAIEWYVLEGPGALTGPPKRTGILHGCRITVERLLTRATHVT